MSSIKRVLEEYQTTTFDTEYVNSELFQQVITAVEKYIDRSELSIVDVGGGNGTYADRLLHKFSNAKVNIIEPDDYLLSKNRQSERKYLQKGFYQDVRLAVDSHDIVGFNWVLHHFVGDDYNESITLQKNSLKKAYDELKSGGLLLIFENFYDGWLLDDLPGKMIHTYTSSQLLKPLIYNLGANTAGVGVCFHSENIWNNMIKEAGFSIISSQHCYDFGNLAEWKRMVLTIQKQHVGFIIAQKP
ncbi:MAG: class I SAM-dependent methyltransferase [Pseudomonadales bacterium]|nr:class I SAM-dependent methyltransferase [Pseudomonadales bacterium]